MATLDFDRLAIDPYLGGAEAPAPPAAQAAVLEGALIKYFDADLRISAAEMTAPVIKLGRGGFTISAKKACWRARWASSSFAAAQASGSVGIDMSQEVAKANVTASLDDMPVEGCLEPRRLASRSRGIERSRPSCRPRAAPTPS